MDFSVLISAFEQGGWGLVLFICICYGGYKLYQKLSAKFEELNSKIDTLKDEITSLKIQGARFEQAIQSCSEPNCPNKVLLKKHKEDDE